MKEIYILSGLGADERVFKLIDFSIYKVNFIRWISPLASESIKNYSKRLVSQIHSERPILVGLSFGGMMAIEISKHLEAEKIVLISSAKTRREIPFYFRWVGILRLNKIVPAALLKKASVLKNWLFGANDAEVKKLLTEILADTDPIHLKWSIDKIVNWKNDYVPPNLAHIHGTADKILPMTKCDFTIEGGSHLMILTKAQEISQLLRTLI